MALPPTDALNLALTEDQMDVLTEIRDLLRVLVEHHKAKEDETLAAADRIRARRAASAR